MAGMKEPRNRVSEEKPLKTITSVLFGYALHYAMFVILVPIVIGSFFLVAMAVDGIRETLYRIMAKDVVDAITPFIACLVGGIAWLLAGYIGYKIMIRIKQAAGYK